MERDPLLSQEQELLESVSRRSPVTIVLDPPPRQSPSPHPTNTPDPPQPIASSTLYDWLYDLLIYTFYSFCLLSGQFFYRTLDGISNVKRVLAVVGWLFCFIHLVANFGALLFNSYVVVGCPYNCSYFYSGNLADMVNSTLPEYVNWYYNAIITTATIAGWFSYYLMTCLILIPLFSDCKCCYRSGACKFLHRACCSAFTRTFQCNAEDLLSPFEDTPKDKMDDVQTFHFYLNYAFNITLYLTSLGLLIVIMVEKISHKYDHQYYINTFGLACQSISQFCAIHSCFIFSKLVYAISNRCEKLIDKFDQVNNAAANRQNLMDLLEQDNDTSMKIKNWFGKSFEKVEDKAHFYVLQFIDRMFIEKAKASLDPYGWWFSVHWILYTLTTILASGLFTRTVMSYLDEKQIRIYALNHCERINLSYIGIFTVQYSLLFLYPCLRAASIAVAREKLIQKVMNRHWENISLSEKEHFIHYLEMQKFSFRVSIFCMHIPVGFNMAYFSLFITVLGVILTVGDSKVLPF